MRFATKYDWWIVAAIGAAPLILVLKLTGVMDRGSHPAPLWIFAGIGVIWVGAMSASWPQYYETRDAGLFIRQGWRRISIPYDKLSAVVASSNSSSAAVFSTDRVLVETAQGKRYIIAPADQPGFFQAVSQRAPQLEPCSGGLHLPFAGLPSI